MEEKRRDAAPQPPSNADSSVSEPSTTRRRGGAQKRKSSALSASNSSSTPSKRVTREKPLPPNTPSQHNGPLTRARQIPSNLSGSSAVSSSTPGGGSASAPAAVKHSKRLSPNGAPGGDLAVAPAEELNKESIGRLWKLRLKLDLKLFDLVLPMLTWFLLIATSIQLRSAHCLLSFVAKMKIGLLIHTWK